MPYVYKQRSDWNKLSDLERNQLRVEYRWMRGSGYARVHAKGTIDRMAFLVIYAKAAA